MFVATGASSGNHLPFAEFQGFGDITAEDAGGSQRNRLLAQRMTINVITGSIVDAAMKVHTALGPGLLESTYEACLAYELSKRGLRVRRQAELPVVYQGIQIDAGYRIDLIVEEVVIVELKSVAELCPIFEAQLLTYLKLSGLKVGLLINFNVEHLKEGIKRMVNKL
jgi:GxxExxY protein